MQPRPKRIARLIMVPFDARESVSLAMAARLSGKSANTIRLWAERYGVGRKIGGDWHISRVALRMFLDGNTAALAAYHAGDLPNPLVRSYFEQAGLQMLISAEVSNELCVHSDGRGQQLQKTQIQQIPQNKSGEQRRPVVAIGLRYAMTADGPQYAMNKELDERGRKPGVDNA